MKDERDKKRQKISKGRKSTTRNKNKGEWLTA